MVGTSDCEVLVRRTSQCCCSGRVTRTWFLLVLLVVSEAPGEELESPDVLSLTRCEAVAQRCPLLVTLQPGGLKHHHNVLQLRHKKESRISAVEGLCECVTVEICM